MSLSLPLLDDRFQPVEPAFPLIPVPPDPGRHVVHVFRPESAFAGSALLLRGHEVRLLEDADVLHHAGERDTGGPRQLADRGGAELQALEDVPAPRIGQRGERPVERLRVNHIVNCSLGGSETSTASTRGAEVACVRSRAAPCERYPRLVIVDEPVRGSFAYLEQPGLFGLPGVDQLRLFIEGKVPGPPLSHLSGLVVEEAALGASTWSIPASAWWQSAAGVF